eukprot:1161348-Pelagomonas_calceolata.AAC.8
MRSGLAVACRGRQQLVLICGSENLQQWGAASAACSWRYVPTKWASIIRRRQQQQQQHVPGMM